MAKIDISKIEGYDAMSAEDKVKLFESFEYDDGASEIERYKSAASKANSEAAEWKKKHNAHLSEEEKAKQETADYIAALEKKNKELLEKETIATYKADLLKIGYSEELADATAKALANGDIAKAIKNQATFVDAQKKLVLANAVKETPVPPAGGESSTVMTKEKLRAMSPAARLEFSQKHPEEYKNIYNNGG
jgi:hypothetical protein